MPKKKPEVDEGVAVRADDTTDLRPDGIAVAIPDVPPATSSGTKTGQTKAATKKES